MELPLPGTDFADRVKAVLAATSSGPERDDARGSTVAKTSKT
ncbi:hypothetical protein ACFWN1_25175 [Streptomyces sp. NPDC058459]